MVSSASGAGNITKVEVFEYTGSEYVSGDYVQIGNDITIGGDTNNISPISMNDDGSIIAYSRLGEREAHVVQYNAATNTWDQLGSTIANNVTLFGKRNYLVWQRKRLFISVYENVYVYKYSEYTSDWF